MSQDHELELNKRHFSGTQQFCYFLMAAAGTCIAAAISHTSDDLWSRVHLLWLLAVISWAISFFFGIRATEERLAFTYRNATYLRFQQQLAANVTAGDQYASELLEKARKELEDTSSGNISFRVQKWSIFVGASSYLAFHYFQMAS
jgi:hypothetical protein